MGWTGRNYADIERGSPLGASTREDGLFEPDGYRSLIFTIKKDNVTSWRHRRGPSSERRWELPSKSVERWKADETAMYEWMVPYNERRAKGTIAFRLRHVATAVGFNSSRLNFKRKIKPNNALRPQHKDERSMPARLVIPKAREPCRNIDTAALVADVISVPSLGRSQDRRQQLHRGVDFRATAP